MVAQSALRGAPRSAALVELLDAVELGSVRAVWIALTADGGRSTGRLGTSRDGVWERYESLSGSAHPNEAVTEQELVRPVLELLGWADYLPQQGTSLHEDIPDHLLFEDADSKARAAAKSRPEDRFADALMVEESKRFGLPLEDADSAGPLRGLCAVVVGCDWPKTGGRRWWKSMSRSR